MKNHPKRKITKKLDKICSIKTKNELFQKNHIFQQKLEISSLFRKFIVLSKISFKGGKKSRKNFSTSRGSKNIRSPLLTLTKKY